METRLSCMQKENFTLAIFFSVRWAIYAWTSEKITHTHWTKRTKSVSIRFASVEQGTASHSCGWCYGLHVYKHLYVLQSMLWYMVTGCCWRITVYVCKLHWLGVFVYVCLCGELSLSFSLCFSISLYHSVHRHWREQIQKLLRANVRSRVSIFTKQPNPLKHDEYVRIRTAKYEWQWLSFSMLFSQHYRCDNCVFGDFVYIYIYI